MKKAIIIISSVLGGIALLGLFFIFFRFADYDRIKSDSDTGTYYSHYMCYDNGTLVVNHNSYAGFDIIADGSEKTVFDAYDSYHTSYLNGYLIHMSTSDFIICDTEGKEVDQVEIDEKIYSYEYGKEDTDVIVYFVTESQKLYRYSLEDKKSEWIATLEDNTKNFFVLDDYVYLESLNEENTASVYKKYKLKSSEPVDTYTIHFGEDITTKVEVIDLEIIDYEIFAFEGYVFYNFSFRNYQYNNLYRYDTKNQKLEFLGRFDSPDFCTNSKEIFFSVDNVGGLDYYEYEQSGIWKMNPVTLETTLVIADYYKNQFLCTDNYIYIYEIKDIGIKGLLRLRQDYDIVQIPID